ncbi:MAG: stage V sporulation protein AC [Sulfobacillus sp.]
MANAKHKKMTPAMIAYEQVAKRREPGRPVLRNTVLAFLIGGGICLIGQFVEQFYITVFHMTRAAAANPTVATLIFFSALLTGLGLYDRLAQWGGAGTSVPVTGFSNAVTSAAIEHRSEGLIAGTSSNMFKIAGPVIVFGVVAAFAVALVRILIFK